jgi:hypothetical protein
MDLSNRDLSFLIESLFQDYILSTLNNKDQSPETLIKNCEYFFQFAKQYNLYITYDNLKDFLIDHNDNGEELYQYIEKKSKR